MIRHFEKKYDDNFGFGKNKQTKKEEKFKFSIKGEQNPTGELENEINIEESLHTKVI